MQNAFASSGLDSLHLLCSAIFFFYYLAFSHPSEKPGIVIIITLLLDSLKSL